MRLSLLVYPSFLWLPFLKWMRLDELSQFHKVNWKWVKGHSGHRENEIADLLANKGIDEL